MADPKRRERQLDAELVEGARAGGKSPFAELVRRHRSEPLSLPTFDGCMHPFSPKFMSMVAVEVK